MIDALIAGKLVGKPVQRTGGRGKPFVTAKVRAAIQDSDALFVNVIAFSSTAQDALLALDDGDSVALSGSLTPKVWTDRNGETRPSLDLTASNVMTAYAVKKKREAVHAKPEAGRQASIPQFDDEINF